MGDSSEHGESLVNGMLEAEKAEETTVSNLSKEHDHVLKTFRILIADLCQQFGGGHPGYEHPRLIDKLADDLHSGAIGMAAIGVSLWKYVMRYAPDSPTWFNRDRFVLSNGHTCLFQYTFLHLTGYKAMNLEKLRTYHSSLPDGICPGHPEIENEGIEVTTGPLGQGITNAVGMAIASKHMSAQFNKPNFPVVQNHIWCMIGDACLQEGVGLEAISLAGHLKLNNLTVIYDNNQITCDGSVDMTNTEDINAKMRACGWDVFDIYDGCFDIDGIVNVLEFSRKSINRPTFVNVRTIIGVGSAVAGNAVAHGVALGADNVKTMKKVYSFDLDQQYVISDEVRDFFKELPERGEQEVQKWEKLMESYSQAHPELAKELQARLNGELGDWESLIPKTFEDKPTPTRQANGIVLGPLASKLKPFIVGTADLTPSVHMHWPDAQAFQHPDLKTECGINGSFSGRYIHYGVREHAMCAIANGLAAYHPGLILPVTSSFFMFYIYAAAAVRMGALQSLQVIHVATHDSIGMGEDGPTHQPLELAALFRAMPNLLLFRPGDNEETAGAWVAAIRARRTPSIISTSRHKLVQQKLTRREGVLKGGYVLEEAEGGKADLTIIGVGAELEKAVDTAKALREKDGLKVRIVSVPCYRLFSQQSRRYQRDTLKRHESVPAIVIEPYVAFGWERFADAAICMSTERFGHSLPGAGVYKYFEFEVEPMSRKIKQYLSDLKSGEAIKGEFVEIAHVPKH